MTFAWPLLLWLLLLPGSWLAWDLFHRRATAVSAQPKILRAEAGPKSLTLTQATGPTRRVRPRVWFVLGLALGIVALARPQWGRLEEPVFEQAREILIATDLSRSMLTPDVKPSRLERSKLLIQSLLDRLQGERVGLVVFSGTAFLQSPLSADYEVLREFLPNLGPDFLPEGGTNYAQLLQTSIEAFGTSNASDRFLIILSDGEATDDNWKDRIPALRQRGIRVIGLGVGTADGGMIPDGNGSFLKDDTGAVVKSHLESGTLKELAQATGGVYVDASNWVDLAGLIHSTVDAAKKGKFSEHNNVRLAERFQWALAPALLLLLVSFWKEFPVRPRPRTIELGSAAGSPPPLPKVAALIALWLCVGVGTARAADPTPAPSQAEILGKIVGRLSAQESRSALDWSEFAQQTLAWGQHIQSTSQPVPESPVRDALAAVELGRQENPKAADWDKMSTGLNDLLKKSEPPKQPPPKDDKKDQDKKNQDQKDQDKKNQDKQDGQGDPKQDNASKQDQKQSQNQPKAQSGQNKKQDDTQSQDGQNKEGGEPPQQKANQSAFGDLAKDQPKTPPPPPSGSTKQVGGVHDDQPFDPAKADPSLAIPLQKLEQVKNQDSPAQLYGLMRRGEPAPPTDKKGKNW